jgi:Domain of unknown function (DUF4157)
MPAARLSSSEHQSLGNLPERVDCGRVKLYRDDEGGAGLLRRIVLGISRQRAVTLGNHVFLPDRCRDDTAVLAHELTHCGQFQQWGPLRYFGSGVVAQTRDLLFRILRVGSSPYRYQLEPLKPFEAYGMEQQGQIVEDAFRGDPVAQTISPYHPRA